MSDSDAFRPVIPDEPCVICGKPDWCRRTTDGAHECHRVNEQSVNGYERIATTPGGFAVYRRPEDRRADDARTNNLPRAGKQPIVKADLTADDRKFRAALPSERNVKIAEQLGVSVRALEAVGCGQAVTEDLKRLRASGAGWREAYPRIVASFPECDATGAIVGFCFRTDDGRKGSPSGKVGAERGLIIPSTLPTRPDPVLLVEGPTDVAACETLYLASVGRPSNKAGGKHIVQLLARRDVLVLGENDQNPAGTWPGREGAEVLAAYLARTWKKSARWTMPPECFKDLRAYVQHLVENGLDVNDEQACREVGQQLLKILQASSTEAHPPASSSCGRKDEGGAARDVLLQLCMGAQDHFFHDNEARAFALVREAGVSRMLPVRSREYALLLSRRYYRATGSGISATAKAEAISTLEGLAIYDGPEEPVFVRIGEFESKVVLDLCDDQWRVVVINQDGWAIVSESPVRFRRTRGMLPLPAPVHGGSINDLRQFLNVHSEGDFVLACAFIIGCFNPCGPFIIQLVNGEQGSAKSTLCRLLRALVDPNKAPLRSEPKDNRDLAVAANNAWVIGLDNMSRISERLSNALCRLATGGGAQPVNCTPIPTRQSSTRRDRS